MKLDRAYIGSCTGGKTSDFLEFARLLQGKRVVIERSKNERDALVSRARAMGTRIAVHHQGRVCGAMRAIRGAVADGRIGALRHLRGQCKGYYGGYGYDEAMEISVAALKKVRAKDPRGLILSHFDIAGYRLSGAFGRAFGTADGQIIVFFVMTVAAAEAAVGLAIVIALFRHRESLNPDAFTALKW